MTSCLWISMQSCTSLVEEAAEEASVGKEQQPTRERASCRRRGAQKKRMENSFQKGGKWKKEGRSNSARVKVKRGEQLLSPPLILTEFFSEMPMFFEHIDSVTLFSCLNSLLGRIKFNPSLFLESVLFCIPLRSEGNRKDKWCDNHWPHIKKLNKGETAWERGLIFRDCQCDSQISSHVI